MCDAKGLVTIRNRLFVFFAPLANDGKRSPVHPVDYREHCTIARHPVNRGESGESGTREWGQERGGRAIFAPDGNMSEIPPQSPRKSPISGRQHGDN